MTDDTLPLAGEEFLTVRIVGGSVPREELLLVGRPRRGVVRVREWTTDTMNTAGHEYDVAAADLLQRFERALSDGRSLGEDPYRVRRWLAG